MKKKNIKRALFVTCIMGMIWGLCGCGAKEDKVETYDSSGIEKIQVTTFAHPVKVSVANDDKITVSISGYENQLAVIADDTMKIELPEPKAGINIKSPQTLYITIPSTWENQIEINSEASNIDVSNVSAKQLMVNTQFGNISISNLSGSLTAKSVLGKIQTDLPISSEINIGDNQRGETLDTALGNADQKSNKITLYTNAGKINIQ